MNYAPPFYMLAKFGREQHVRAFRERGQLYMNSLAYFWILEKDAARAISDGPGSEVQDCFG